MLDAEPLVNGKLILDVLRRSPAKPLCYRHAMLVDQKTEGVSVPLNEFLKSEGRLELANSKLFVMLRSCPLD